ncbi:MAG: baseplate J/gp47 family protein, partial [Aedoeadaptatus pacaensis]
MANVTELKHDVEQYLSGLYTDKNFEDIMENLLSRVPDDIDKREGSVIYDALAPVAIELMLLYYEYVDTIKNSFGITADRPSLILRAMDRDVHIKEATHSIVKGAFNREIPQGYRFNYEKLNFRVEGSLGMDDKRNLYLYKLRAEEPGSIGNVAFGNLTPIDEIGNLSYAKIEGVLTPGADAEDTEAFRRRYYDSIKRSDYGGNIDDYKRKVTAIDGVGAVKVYPVWNGGGTVKLVIQNSEYKTPSKEMIDDLQTKVDPVTNHGKGMGIAPIGHTVTVTGAVRMPIKVK